MKTIILALSFLLAFSVIAGRSIPRNYYRAEGRHGDGTGGTGDVSEFHWSNH